jgi:hypothetical protein
MFSPHSEEQIIKLIYLNEEEEEDGNSETPPTRHDGRKYIGSGEDCFASDLYMGG